ncbi:hypothetical protein E2562_007834 [Oryza meyeriana var. granulata]|uniref:Uncharacterized protein n=1 Tax=Oryza meyeriana var. granulata TaxID=110450 RepID=A0A6G1F538_9ORYZ|nr:hypothetical protein E2562_007834 [Oryza meyeriana var. granulata]
MADSIDVIRAATWTVPEQKEARILCCGSTVARAQRGSNRRCWLKTPEDLILAINGVFFYKHPPSDAEDSKAPIPPNDRRYSKAGIGRLPTA